LIPDSFKQDLLNRVDIVDVIERYVPLKKTGSNFSACCPFHTEKSPSFTVSPTKQFYHCFGCGAHGNAITFVMEYQGLGYVEAVKDLAEDVGMKLPDFEPRQRKPGADAGPDLHAILERASHWYREQLKAAPHAIEYLKKRGLTGKVAARFGIGYAPDGWQGLQAVFPDYADKGLKEAGLVIDNDEGRRYDRFRDRIMFPILNQRGAVIGFGGRVLGDGEPKYLNSPETPLFEKGRELYGLSQARLPIRESGRAIVVEGYMDVVALAQHGVEYAVATLGTATSATHIGKLLRQTDELVFCFDGDAAGRRAAWHALEVSLPLLSDQKTVRFLFLPAEDDPDSYVRAHGREAFETKVAEARPLSAFLISELQGRVDMDSVEGRARLIHEAKPLLQKIAAPAMQLQMVKRLAELSGMTTDESMQLCGIRLAPPPAPRPAAGPARDGGEGRDGGGWQGSRQGGREAGNGRQGSRPPWQAPPARQAMPSSARLEKSHLMLRRRPLQELLQCVLAKPVLVEDLPIELLDPEQPEAQALSAIAAYLREQPDATTALVMGHLEGSEHEVVIGQARQALMEDRISDTSVDDLFRSHLVQLSSAPLKERLEVLKQTLSERELTGPERQEYAQLIQELNALKPKPSGEQKVV
jgi:DNA primase